MFCPVCKSEYRQGFTKCSDCGADLVARPDSDDEDPVAMEILWTGTDPKFAGLLSEALDRAELQHRNDAVALGFLPAMPGEVFKVSVRATDREAAERVLQDVMDGKTAESSTEFPDVVRGAVR